MEQNGLSSYHRICLIENIDNLPPDNFMDFIDFVQGGGELISDIVLNRIDHLLSLNPAVSVSSIRHITVPINAFSAYHDAYIQTGENPEERVINAHVVYSQEASLKGEKATELNNNQVLEI